MIQRMNNVLIKHSKVLFGVITIVIIISFVWFFTPGADGSLLFSRNSNVIAKIGDVEVTTSDAERVQKSAVLGQAPSLYAAYGEKSAEFFSRMGRMNDDQLRIIAATLKLAEIQGFAVSDAEVQEELKNNPAFQENGKFSMQKYDAFIKLLDTVGYSVEDFENATRDSLLLKKFQESAFAGVAAPTESEVMADLAPMLFKFTRKVVSFDETALKAAIPEPTEAEIKAKYDANPDAYKFSASNATIFFINHKDVKVDDLEKKVEERFSAYPPQLVQGMKPEDIQTTKESLKGIITAEAAAALLTEIVADAGEKPTAESLKAAAEKKGIKLQSMPVTDLTEVTAPSGLVDKRLLDGICAIQEKGGLTQVVSNNDSAAVAMLDERQEPVRMEYAAVKTRIATELKEERGAQKVKEAQEKLNAFRADIVNGKIALDKIDEEAEKLGLKILTNPATESAASQFTAMYQAAQDINRQLEELIMTVQSGNEEKVQELTGGMDPQWILFMMQNQLSQIYGFLSEIGNWKLGYVSDIQNNSLMVITEAIPADVTDDDKKVRSDFIYGQKRNAAYQSWLAWYQKEIMAAIGPYTQKQEQSEQPGQQPAE